MCGLAGWVTTRHSADPGALAPMVDALAHRNAEEPLCALVDREPRRSVVMAASLCDAELGISLALDGALVNAAQLRAELGRHGVPHRLLAGPWAHADPTTAMPGPRIDFDAELAGWFDHWLRGTGTHEDGCDVFVRTSTRPEIDLDLHEGWWVTLPTVPPVTEATLDLTAPVSLDVVPDVGTAAWIDCAGHLPWGLSGDQRLDDERSLTWEIDTPPAPVVGHPVFRAKVWATQPAASLSVKICDVFPDGTSALVTRGTLDLQGGLIDCSAGGFSRAMLQPTLGKSFGVGGSSCPDGLTLSVV